MKKTAFAAAALAFTAGSALAADLPSRKAAPMLPPPPPPAMWTGFYAGLNAGGSWGGGNAINTVAGPVFLNPSNPQNALLDWAMPSALGASQTMSSNAGGFIGGGQIGYNWQFMGSFVVGVEADIQGLAGANGSASSLSVTQVGGDPLSQSAGAPIWTFGSASKSLDYLGTVRGRIGYLVTPTLLVYGTGGLAYGGVNMQAGYTSYAPTISPLSELTNAWGGAGSFSNTQVGWTAGGGVEWMFWPNWSAKVEYLYYDLGRASFSQSPSGAVINFAKDPRLGQAWWLNASQASTRFDGNIIRAGLNYHFNWGASAPVVAKF